MRELSDYEMFLLNNGYMKRCVTPENNVNYANNMKMNMNKFTSAQDGFYKGNMMNDEYVPYKNMQVIRPMVNNEKGAMLEQIQEYAFASHDINLYLDTHPSDKNAIDLYNKYNNESDRLTKEYTSKYGPINLRQGEGLNGFPWKWIDNPWPWNNN